MIKESETRIYNGESTTTVSEYTYDENGNMIKEVYTNSENEKSTYTYEYDKTGNLIKEVYTSPSGVTRTTTYTYDENGNLIKVAESGTGEYALYDSEFTAKYEFVYIPFEICEDVQDIFDNMIDD